jgi:two-component system, LuxR family, sensor kinase FixL
MNWITVSWPMVASATLTLGLIELRISLAQPPRLARLLFSLSAFAITVQCGVELAIMRADTLASALYLLRWEEGAVGAIFALLTAFIWTYFGTGSKWLALASPTLYALGAAADLIPGSDMTYQSITGLRTVETFAGATFNVIEGVPNPWNAFEYLSALALVVFVVDASVRLWKRGGRRRALVVGGNVTLFILSASVCSLLVETRIVDTPYLFSWAYLAILVAMASELNIDVLASARIARKLRESERRMELACAAGNLGMWAWDLVHDTIWATARARALLGFSESEILSQEKLTNALHPEDRELRRHALQNALANGKEYEVQYRVPLGDGQIRWISSRGRPEANRNGKPVLVRGVVLDISARRGAEIKMQRLHDQLAHSSRVSMMGQLASAIAHELGQPLTAILANTEAASLTLENEAPDLDELRAILTDIRRDDQRAADVIERMRALLKRRNFVARTLSVGELLETVVILTRIDCSARKVILEVAALPPDLPFMTGDSVLIQQVLINLVLNATDAVEAFDPERRKVVLRAVRHENGGVEFSVSDSGPGIQCEKLRHVFEPFFTTKPSGMGLGLSISRSIVEAHGGRIWVVNNAGEGATFRFTLPNPAAGVMQDTAGSPEPALAQVSNFLQTGRRNRR